MMRKKAPRLLLILLFAFSCFLASVKPSNAAISSTGDWAKGVYSNEATNRNANAFTSKNADKEKFDGETLSNIQVNIALNTIGISAVPSTAMLPAERAILEKQIGYGVLGEVNKGIIALYTPPASTRTYVADLMKSAKMIPEAQAQGIGFSSLDPILSTWKIFRNIAYFFFVIIFMIIGFMIMFRTKVGQAAITAQQAIPSVIVAMLAVTFSYAIAGFMIDLMYLIMFMIAGIFTGESGSGNTIVTKNIFGLIGLMFSGTNETVLKTVEDFMSEAIGGPDIMGQVLGIISGLTATVIMGIAILYCAVKIFFELIKTYIAVLVQIIFAPITLMMGALPGKNVFSKWIKNLAGNLIVWPVVLLCVVVQQVLRKSVSVDTDSSGGFLPPFLIGSGQGEIVPVILGLGVLLVIPDIMKQVKKAMGVEDGPFGQLAGAALKQFETGVPLGGRVGGAVAGAGLGAAKGVLRGTFGKDGRDHLGRVFRAVGDKDSYEIKESLKGLGSNVLTKTGSGARSGASGGVNLTSIIERKTGINQPDILNPATTFIDTGELPWNKGEKPAMIGKFDGLASEKEKKKQSGRRNAEDYMDLLTRNMQGLPPKKDNN